ncbi:MAG: hypothetical protein NDI61_13900 [Bdellovibrionaceae bacterium]|nr:hypothetical protein [Pseudobdellovibrionaceae bacterium]
MRNMILAILALFAFAGCATRYPLLSTPAVSTTEKSFVSGYKAKPVGPVNARYCMGEDSIAGKKSTIGLMDEVIARAQSETKASYISDAQFFAEGQCVILEGTAMKVE